MSNSGHFDKFIEDFEKRDSVKKEKSKKYCENHSDSPQRRYNKLYRELWQNRIRYIVKSNKNK
jgi:hypothetical protein